MKIRLDTHDKIVGRDFTGAIETRLLIKDRLRVQVSVNGKQFSLSSVMGSLGLERTLTELQDGAEIEVEIPDDAEGNVEEIRRALEETFGH